MGQSERVEEAVAAFLLDRERKKKSERTIEHDALVMHQFVRSLGRRNPWMANISAGDVYEFFYGKGGVSTRVAGQSFNQYLSKFRKFESFAMRRGWWKQELSGDIESVPTEEKDDKLRLSVEESYELLDTIDDPRDRAAVALGFTLGLRSGEIERARCIDWRTGPDGVPEIVVRRTKSATSHMRFIHMATTEELDAELGRWFAVYAADQGITVSELLTKESWYMFPSRLRIPAYVGAREATWKYQPGIHMYRPGRIVRNALEAAGYTDKHVGFHTARRSAGRAYFDWCEEDPAERGDPIRQTQMLLGHARMEQVAPYIGVTPDEKRRNRNLRNQKGFRSRPTPTIATVRSINSAKGA